MVLWVLGIYGGAGNDVLTGGPGRDAFEGGPGQDVLIRSFPVPLEKAPTTLYLNKD